MYFTIKNELNDEIVGKAYPQVECLSIFQAHLINPWRLFDPKPKLKFQLKKKAFQTNALLTRAISSKGFLIDRTTLDIFLEFNLMQHQVFEAPVECNGRVLEYYWLHLSEPDLTKQLDYTLSTFYRTEYTFREEPIILKNYNQYEILKKSDKNASFGVEVDQIAFSENFNKSLDLFTFIPFTRRIYISENLKKALEERKITGFKIEEATNFI